tara:strand:+ start:497 stop:673 length:177 start_codon:yes stop_codon:yes gene_type:complete
MSSASSTGRFRWVWPRPDFKAKGANQKNKIKEGKHGRRKKVSVIFARENVAAECEEQK